MGRGEVLARRNRGTHARRDHPSPPALSGSRRAKDHFEDEKYGSDAFRTQAHPQILFGKIREVAEMPNLIEVQKSSYDLFLQRATAARAGRRRGHSGRVPVRLPDQGLQRDLGAGVREATSSSRRNTTSRNASSAT